MPDASEMRPYLGWPVANEILRRIFLDCACGNTPGRRSRGGCDGPAENRVCSWGICIKSVAHAGSRKRVDCGSALRLRSTGRGRPGATPRRAGGCVAGRPGIGRANAPARVGACDRFRLRDLGDADSGRSANVRESALPAHVFRRGFHSTRREAAIGAAPATVKMSRATASSVRSRPEAGLASLPVCSHGALSPCRVETRRPGRAGRLQDSNASSSCLSNSISIALSSPLPQPVNNPTYRVGRAIDFFSARLLA